MHLSELTAPELIFPDLAGGDGESILRELTAKLAALGRVRKPERLLAALCEREAIGSTALGKGVAIPHCRVAGLSKLLVAVGLSRQGVDFAAEDGAPVRAFFVVISPQREAAEHLHCLAAISKWVKNGCMERLFELDDAQEIYSLIDDSPASNDPATGNGHG